MSTPSLAAGDLFTFAGSSWKTKRALTDDPEARAWLVIHGRQRRWIWEGLPRDVCEALGAVLKEPGSDTLACFAGVEDVRGAPRVMLKPRLLGARPLYQTTWRSLPPHVAVDALMALVLDLEVLHEAGVYAQGLAREHVLWDETTQRLMIGALPRAEVLEGTPEQVWRDVRLVGELLYENLMCRDYPGGHAMAAMLQSGDTESAEVPWQPGHAQVIAGCVTPYGELAFTHASMVHRALQTLRMEQERPLRLSVGAHSTIGNYIFRKNNQDSCGHLLMQTICGSRTTTAGFFCVADGIGGIQDGERASALAIQTGCQAFGRACSHPSGEALLHKPTLAARGIASIVSQRLAMEGEFVGRGNRGGTTYSSLVIVGGRVGVAHVGDSRITLLRRGELFALTRDHNLRAILEALGEFDEGDEAQVSLSERTISRFMTTSGELESGRIDSFTLDVARALDERIETLLERGLKVERGDLFLLTSDGVHGEVSDAEIIELVLAHADPQRLCDALVQAVLDRRGRDNITALAVRVE